MVAGCDDTRSFSQSECLLLAPSYDVLHIPNMMQYASQIVSKSPMFISIVFRKMSELSLCSMHWGNIERELERLVRGKRCARREKVRARP